MTGFIRFLTALLPHPTRMEARYPRLPAALLHENTRTSVSRKPGHPQATASHRTNHEPHQACNCVQESHRRELLSRRRHHHESSVDPSGQRHIKVLDTPHQPSRRKDASRTSVRTALGHPRDPSHDRRAYHEPLASLPQKERRRRLCLLIGRQRLGRQ